MAGTVYSAYSRGNRDIQVNTYLWGTETINPYLPRYAIMSSADRDPDMHLYVVGPTTGIHVQE